MKFATPQWRSGPKPPARALSPSRSSAVIPRVLLSEFPWCVRVTARTCHLPALSLSRRRPSPNRCSATREPRQRALGEGRPARVGAAGRGPRGHSCDVSVWQRGQHLSRPPPHLHTQIQSRSPFRTGLTTTSEGWKRGVPRLSNSATGSRDEEVAKTSQVRVGRRSQPAARAGAEAGGDGPGKDAELTCDPAGERFHSPSRLRLRGTFLPARLRGAQRGSPFPCKPPPVSSPPLSSSERGHADDLKEFVQSGSVGQVC